eukprot:jgi/Psemu1/39354/gm1.39354_g
MAKKGRRFGVINYSRTEVLELLHTLKAILPVGPEEWAQASQIHEDNFPDTNQSVANLLKLAKRVKWLIKGKEGVGDGEGPYNMVEGYQNNTEDKEYISSEEEEDGSDNDNIPLIPLCQPSQRTQPTQQSTEPTQPTQQPTQPTQPSQTTQEPIVINVPATIVPRSQSQLASSSSSSQRFVPSSPSPSSTPQSKRQYHRNTNGRQDILDFLRENSELEREQRREDHWLEREHRKAVFQAQRQQTEAALELLKAAIVDVATIFLNGLRPNSNSNLNPPPAGDST